MPTKICSGIRQNSFLTLLSLDESVNVMENWEYKITLWVKDV
jgi:hypothetical protein